MKNRRRSAIDGPSSAAVVLPLLLLPLPQLALPSRPSSSSSFLLPVAYAQDSSSSSIFQSEDYYCGTSWADAALGCYKNCTSGEDDECVTALGAGYECHGFTGCHAKLTAVDDDDDDDDDDDAGDGGVAVESSSTGADDGTSNNFCGQSWVGAMLTCSEPCPSTTECAYPDRCWSATNCDRPLEQLVSDIVTTLSGPDTIMDDADLDIFSGTVFDYINDVAKQEGISLGGVKPMGQSVATRRVLQNRAEYLHANYGKDRYLHFDISNITLRKLPTGSSAVDVSVVVTGEYRPPPYLDLDVIAEESINRDGDGVVKSLRERGSDQGRNYFDDVQGIEAVRASDMTARPTGSPIGTPTIEPTISPTVDPSEMPSSDPSSMPSSSPSLTVYRVVTIGTADDLQIQDSTTKSYGFMFDIRTKVDAPVVLFTGMDIYTESTGDITYEVWSRIGSYVNAKADRAGWDLIASGTTTGRGVGRYTTIPDETFTPVEIPGGGGDGGTRAVYVTLDYNVLAYKIPPWRESTEVFFVETPEVEITEGEGVLRYEFPEKPLSEPPYPDPDDIMWWKMPRQFLGTIRYDRVPCKPFDAYGLVYELPCPLIPTGSPTLPQPTFSPMVPPTLSPTLTPTTAAPGLGMPTGAPFVGQTPAPVIPPTVMPTTAEPSLQPTTAAPSVRPVVPMRANIITTLRNVPEREMTPRESEKYIESLIVFLRRYTGTTMVLDGIDLWHQELTIVDAKEGSVTANATAEESFGESTQVDEGAARAPQVSRSEGDILTRKLKGTGAAYEAGPTGPKKKQTPKVTAMQVTLILRITFSNLPSNLLGSMASVAIQENEQDLLDLLHEQQAFYTFFKLVDGVESLVIEEVTPTPTDTPTSYSYFLAQQEALLSVEEDAGADTGVGIAVFVGVGIGFLWCCLTAISVTYLFRARNEMKERRDMEDLLKAETTNSLDAEKANSLYDTDNEYSVTGEDDRPPVVAQLAPGADAKIIKSIIRTSEGTDQKTNLRRSSAVKRSMVVTPQEKVILLGGETANRDVPAQTGRGKLNQSMVLPAKSDGIKQHHNLAKSMIVKDSGTESPAKRRDSTASIASNNGIAVNRDITNQTRQKKLNQSMVLPAKSDNTTQHRNLAKSMIAKGSGTESPAKRRDSTPSISSNDGIAANRDIAAQTRRKKLNQSVVLPAKSDSIKQHHNLAKSMIAKGSGTKDAAERRRSAASASSQYSREY